LTVPEISSSNTCTNYLIDSTQASFSCGTPHFYTSTQLKSIKNHPQILFLLFSFFLVPSPYKKLAVSFTLNPTSFCVTGGNDVDLFTVSYISLLSSKFHNPSRITPPGTTTPKKIIYVAYTHSTKTIGAATEDTSGLKLITNWPIVCLFFEMKPYDSL